MSVWSKLRSMVSTEQKAWTELDTYFSKLIGSNVSKTGVNVTLQKALRVATVLACARVMSEDVAAMPFRLVQVGEDGFEAPATSHPLYKMFELGPNDWQTGFEFRETMMMHLMLTGNAYFYKNVVRKRVVELLPFLPGQVTAKQGSDRSIQYVVNGSSEFSDTTFEGMTLPASEVWHIRGPSMDTLVGLDVVNQAREAIGLAMATEETHAQLHKNGIQSTGAYSVEGALTPDEHRKLTNWLVTHYAGLNNTGKPLVLDRGAKWNAMTLSGVDSEHLATRAFQIEEVCRAMRVIPIMVGHSDKTSTYASAEQMFLSHNNIVGKWCRRIDSASDKSLLDPSDYDAGLRSKHQINALLYADTQAKAAWYTALWMIGSTNANEIRQSENMKPYVGGEKFFIPVNAQTSDRALATPVTPEEAVATVKKMMPALDINWEELTERLKQRNA